MDVEVTKNVLIKLIENLVIPDLKPDIDYNLYYEERYKKFVLDIDVNVDVSKMFSPLKTYDSEYINQVHELENVFDDVAKYSGMGWDKMTIRIRIFYFNDDFLYFELKRLQDKLIDRLVNEKGIDRELVNDLWVDVYKSSDDNAYIRLEVGMSDSVKFMDAGYRVDMIEDMVHEELGSPSSEFPVLHDLYLDEVDYWWDY